MRLTHSLTAALGLLLLAPFAALAHQGHPRHISVEYTDPKGESEEIRIVFTNTTDDMTTAAINLCRAKDQLPPNWDLSDSRYLTTAVMCKDPPWYGSNDHGRIVFNVPKGQYTDANKMGAVRPGRYVVSVVLFLEDPGSHHDSGQHPTWKLITLTAPEPACGVASPCPSQ